LNYSHSQLETFESCPLKYRLQYRDRIKTGRKSIEAFMGTMVHDALEKLYRDLRMSCRPDLEELIKYYLAKWETSFGEGVFVVRSEYSPEDYRETGLRCIRDYYGRYAPFGGGIPVWLERKVNIPVQDTEGRAINFTGVLDRLDSCEGGMYEIHDYKTSSFLPTRQDLEEDRQLSLYQLAVEEAFPDVQAVDLVWHYLTFDRELRLRRERPILERISGETANLVREIEGAVEFPPRESRLCEWCDVQEHCPKRKHLFMVAKTAERELGTDRGIQLVDEYARWMEQKREAEEHLKELREEILDFSSYQVVDNLQGSSCILKITRGQLPKLPATGSAERAELEKLLCDCGAWQEVSTLNARKLGAALSQSDIDEELSGRLEPLIEWEETPTLRLKNQD
jgi:putative RecB family exonuclease